MISKTQADLHRKRDTACAECMDGTNDRGFVVEGFRCHHHLNDAVTRMENSEMTLLQTEGHALRDLQDRVKRLEELSHVHVKP